MKTDSKAPVVDKGSRRVIPDMTCPECGGPMVRRIIRKTRVPFAGCAAYPECPGTASLPKADK